MSCAPYDLLVEVGCARFAHHRQDAEIHSDLQRRWALSLPVSSIGLLCHSFLDGLAALHQAHAATLRRRLAEDGGYAMPVDGTCEPGTEVLFAALLVCNLADPEYLNLVLGGSLANLPSAIAKHWPLAHPIRQHRLAPTPDHPLPTTKKQIRAPDLLENIKQTIQKMLEAILGRLRVA